MVLGRVDVQVEEAELARTATVLVDEPTCQVAAEDGAEVGVGDLLRRQR